MIWKCWCGEAGPSWAGWGGPGLQLSLGHSFPSFLQPDTLGALPNLRELWLDRNQLSALPPVSEGVATSTSHSSSVDSALNLCTPFRSLGTCGAWCAWMYQRTGWRRCPQSWGD